VATEFFSIAIGGVIKMGQVVATKNFGCHPIVIIVIIFWMVTELFLSPQKGVCLFLESFCQELL
jgi:hypothetical protein